jgi:hypothetical protein
VWRRRRQVLHRQHEHVAGDQLQSHVKPPPCVPIAVSALLL